MAQAGVAREPSMEEILASIRKIIESNDGPDQTETTGGPEISNQNLKAEAKPDRPLSMLTRDQEPAVTSASSDRNDTAPLADRQDLHQNRIDPLRKEAPAFADMELRTSERVEVGRTANEELGMSRTVLSHDTGVEAELSAAKAVPRGGVEHSAEIASTEAGSAVSMPAGNETDNVELSEPAEPAELSALTEPAQPIAPATHSPDTVEECGSVDETDAKVGSAQAEGGLMSPAEGARVAASFGTLNHAITHGPARSFDEIAEDMLRPMLQEWLDDNLPTLVERLVREEIERIARGQ